MRWRRLRPDELDHELIWLGVSLSAAALAWVWLWIGLPTPGCVFHAVTGFPCPTCGATRCVRLLFEGDPAAAVLLNPLVALALGGLAVFDVYAGVVLSLRLPRLRGVPSPGLAKVFRAGALAVLLLNWAWLIRGGV